jgi:hypothetical protein
MRQSITIEALSSLINKSNANKVGAKLSLLIICIHRSDRILRTAEGVFCDSTQHSACIVVNAAVASTLSLQLFVEPLHGSVA